MAQETPKSKREMQIDQNLKSVYSEMLGEEIPDRFKDLLDQLRKQDASGTPEAQPSDTKGGTSK